MAFTTLLLEHPVTGAQKQAPVGVSWTVLFFCFFPPLFRGDIKWGLIMLAFWLLSAGLFSSWLVHLVFMFFYNKLYIKELLAEGYQVRSLDEAQRQRIVNHLDMRLPMHPDSSTGC